MHEYEESRDREMAASAEAEAYVLTATQAVAVDKAKAEGGRCERPTCLKRHKFWVQRGPVGILVCGPHLSTAVQELHAIKPGRYGHNEFNNGYWISRTSTVTVKMKVGEVWR